jgi:FtsZ-interacting cell division protein ZipA
MSLREYLPSKRIGYGIIILAAIVIIALVIQYMPSIRRTTIFSKNTTTTENQQTSSKIADIVNKDTDGDGVFDWEESIRGTDPSKTDTDGDGVSDFTEIEQLRAQEGGSDQNTPETETTIFAKQLFSTIASLQQSGTLDEENATQIVNQVSSTAQKNVQKTFYTKEQLVVSSKLTGSIFEKNTEAIMKKYAVTYQTLQNVFVLLKAIPETEQIDGNPNLETLKNIDTSFKKAIGELLKNPVPDKSADIYLDFLNSFQYVSENISDITLLEENPVVSFSATTIYPKNTVLLIDAATLLSKEYRK